MRLILKPSPCASPLIPRCGEVRTVVQKGQLMGQTNWTSLGSPSGQSTDTFITPRVVQNADGRLEVLLTGSDGNLWHIWQTTPGKEWSTWASLNKPPNVSMISTPIAARNADGRIEAFCTGADDALWHIWQTTPGGSWGIWFSSGKPSSSVGVVNEGSLCVERNADGRLEAFAKGTDLALWHIWHTWQVTPGGEWGS